MSLYMFRALNAHLQEDTPYTCSIWYCHSLREWPVGAQQAKEVHQYHNIKRKLYRTAAAIWYNKTCRDRQLTPKYTSIRINGHNKQSQKTPQMTPT